MKLWAQTTVNNDEQISTDISTAKTEAIGAAASDATSKANAAEQAAISAASTDATQKANAAQSAAEATASADATAKANAAETNAKAYADDAIDDLRDDLETQIDAKIETWAQSTNPATSWTTSAQRASHNADLWLYTGTSSMTVGSVTINPQGVYQYNGSTGAWAAYSSTTDNLFDMVDGKSTVYYGSTSDSFPNKEVDDYLVETVTGSTYRWDGSSWAKVTDYKTYTDAAATEAAKTATTYLTTITGRSGICVHDAADVDNYVNINSDGMSVYKDDESVAFFGDTARVGIDGDAGISITDRAMHFYGNKGSLVGQILSNQLASGEFTQYLTDKYATKSYKRSDYFHEALPYDNHIYYNGKFLQNTFPVKIFEGGLRYDPDSNISVKFKIYNHSSEDYDWHTVTLDYTVDNDITQDGLRVVYDHTTRALTVYRTTSDVSPYMETIYREPVVFIDPSPLVSESRSRYEGGYAVRHYAGNIEYLAEKTSATSVSFNVPPKGSFYVYVCKYTNNGPTVSINNRNNNYPFTAGQSETISHPGDGYSRISYSITYNAATNTITSNQYIYKIEYQAFIPTSISDAEITYNREFYAPQFEVGLNNNLGTYGCTSIFGEGLEASSPHQTILGRFNLTDADDALEIGSGDYVGDQKNAMAVKWNGNTTIAGTLTQLSDNRLKDHIDYLDDDAAEFIRDLKPAHFKKDGIDHVGFYAQDVEESDKWDCMTGEMNGYLTLGYTELIAPLVKYCQKLEKRIEDLEQDR